MKDLQVEFAKILDSQSFDESQLDYAVLERRIDEMNRLSALSNSMITLFDHFRRRHVYASANHRDVFGFGPRASDTGDQTDFDIRIHPEDMYPVMRNGIVCMRHFFIGNKNAAHHKLIREYRVEIRGVYKRITEQIQVLETDSRGNIWLAFCVMDLSPDQCPPYVVNSKLIDCRSGDIITPLDRVYDGKPLLSDREVGILRLVNDGMMSKEIANQLSISVHTVNTHRQHILEKLQVGTSIEAIKYASALGLFGD